MRVELASVRRTRRVWGQANGGKLTRSLQTKAGHVRQGCRRGEQRRVAGSVIGAEEPGRHVGLEVPDHAGVQMAAARLKVGRAERLHGDGVRIVD
jgi:hypothetical protein